MEPTTPPPTASRTPRLDPARLDWAPTTSSLLGYSPYGAIYAGTFDGQPVAVKLLRPAVLLPPIGGGGGGRGKGGGPAADGVAAATGVILGSGGADGGGGSGDGGSGGGGDGKGSGAGVPPSAAVGERRRRRLAGSAVVRFARELRRHSRLRHPAVVRFFGVARTGGLGGVTDGPLLLVMEHLGGGDLAASLVARRRAARSRGSACGGGTCRPSPLPMGLVLRLGGQLTAALRYLHAEQVSHGELCPANLCLSEALPVDDVVGNGGDGDGGGGRADDEVASRLELKVSNFGLSRSIDATWVGDGADDGVGGGLGGGSASGSLSRTTTGVEAVGAYLPPEAYAVHPATLERAYAADVWAAAVVIQELATGVAPWEGVPPPAMVSRLMAGERPPWGAEGDVDVGGEGRDVAPAAGVLADLRRLVERCLVADWKLRPSAVELSDSLVALTSQWEREEAATAAAAVAAKQSLAPLAGVANSKGAGVTTAAADEAEVVSSVRACSSGDGDGDGAVDMAASACWAASGGGGGDDGDGSPGSSSTGSSSTASERGSGGGTAAAAAPAVADVQGNDGGVVQPTMAHRLSGRTAASLRSQLGGVGGTAAVADLLTAFGDVAAEMDGPPLARGEKGEGGEPVHPATTVPAYLRSISSCKVVSGGGKVTAPADDGAPPLSPALDSSASMTPACAAVKSFAAASGLASGVSGVSGGGSGVGSGSGGDKCSGGAGAPATRGGGSDGGRDGSDGGQQHQPSSLRRLARMPTQPSGIHFVSSELAGGDGGPGAAGALSRDGSRGGGGTNERPEPQPLRQLKRLPTMKSGLPLVSSAAGSSLSSTAAVDSPPVIVTHDHVGGGYGGGYGGAADAAAGHAVTLGVEPKLVSSAVAPPRPSTALSAAAKPPSSPTPRAEPLSPAGSPPTVHGRSGGAAGVFSLEGVPVSSGVVDPSLSVAGGSLTATPGDSSALWDGSVWSANSVPPSTSHRFSDSSETGTTVQSTAAAAASSTWMGKAGVAGAVGVADVAGAAGATGTTAAMLPRQMAVVTDVDDDLDVSSLVPDTGDTHASDTSDYATPVGGPALPPRVATPASRTVGQPAGHSAAPGSHAGSFATAATAAATGNGSISSGSRGPSRSLRPPPRGVTSVEVAAVSRITEAARSGAHTPILSALRTHAGSLAVVAAGVCGLAHLARGPTASLLITDGAVKSLVRAFVRHGKDHVSVAAPVCAALARLLSGRGGGGGDAAASPALARTCRALGVGGVLIAAAAAHPQRPEVAAAACAGLAGLAAIGGGGGPAAVRAVHSALANALFMVAADEGPDGVNGGAFSFAAASLSLTASGDGGGGGGGDLLSTLAGVRDVWTPAEAAEVALAALTAVRALCWRDTVAAAEALSCGLVDAVVEAATAFPSPPTLPAAVVAATATLAPHGPAVLLAAGAVASTGSLLLLASGGDTEGGDAYLEPAIVLLNDLLRAAVAGGYASGGGGDGGGSGGVDRISVFGRGSRGDRSGGGSRGVGAGRALAADAAREALLGQALCATLTAGTASSDEALVTAALSACAAAAALGVDTTASLVAAGVVADAAAAIRSAADAPAVASAGVDALATIAGVASSLPGGGGGGSSGGGGGVRDVGALAVAASGVAPELLAAVKCAASPPADRAVVARAKALNKVVAAAAAAAAAAEGWEGAGKARPARPQRPPLFHFRPRTGGGVRRV
ncbi:hypothetical protein MMPV_003536 [Pyropia vietnamensis]